jgi:hypothetical protein
LELETSIGSPPPVLAAVAPGVIHLVAMMYMRYPLSLRKDLLAERGIDTPRDSPVLLEPVWSDVQRQDPARRAEHAYRLERMLADGADE